jgi:hypothetical protein
MLRSLLWRLLALALALLAAGELADLIGGAAGRALRGRRSAHAAVPDLTRLPLDAVRLLPSWVGVMTAVLLATVLTCVLTLGAVRLHARSHREYLRLRVLAYRGDTAEPGAVAHAYLALHAALSVRRWRRLWAGQPSVSLEVHHGPAAPAAPPEAWLAVCCPAGAASIVQAALRGAYPNLRLGEELAVAEPDLVLRLGKRHQFTRRLWTADRRTSDRGAEPLTNRLITAMGACAGPALTQIALTPAPVALEMLAKRMFKAHEARLSRARQERADRSMVEDVELRGGLDVQHSALFFADVRVVAQSREDCDRIASVLRAQRAENRLVERGTALRQGRLGLYSRRVLRGEGNPLPSLLRGVLAPRELCELWQLPSVDYAGVPFSRASIPLAPAPPSVWRPGEGGGTLRDAFGPVSIHEELRRQNTAVPGTVEQGKSSYLVASVAEDLRRERCAVIVLDPKGDAAEAALSAVPAGRICTLLDFADPTCGFNPLAVEAPADVIADYVVAALKNLFSDADIRASSDRYLRNAIIAVLAADPASTLWDAARLLSVGEEGYAYRRAVAARVRELPELKEISSFFTAELTAQLADARSATTSKLDAPVNKLARLLNSPSIKRVLLNDSLQVDFDRVIARGEVLVVKGALGAMGAGNTSVLMQLLVGMLDAALARQQDQVDAGDRTAVALKVDEAPLVLNRGFAETMALKRSAGLETVACWQTDAQWVDREVRDQLDALFAHRVYFATASARDARSAAALTMAEFSDSIRPGVGRLSPLGSPDVRLRLPRHHAIASWTTLDGRQAAFVAETIPLTVDPERLAVHAAAQLARGGRRLTDLAQTHWERTSATEPPRDHSHPDANVAPAPAAEAGAPPAPEPPAEGRPRLPAEPSGSDAGRPPPAEPTASEAPTLPARPAESFRELVDLDCATGARRVPSPRPTTLDRPDDTDLEVLRLIGALGHVLSSQIHRRLNSGHAISTTQRRLKRLADAGLIERLQFHRPDGGGMPMCCSLAPGGQWMLERHAEGGGATPHAGHPEQPVSGRQELAGIRRALHAAGWGLAMAERFDVSGLSGCSGSVLSPRRSGGAPSSPGTLQLPGGLVAHDFLRTTAAGSRIEPDRFETIRPDLTLSLRLPRDLDLLVDFDDRISGAAWVNRVERYDHFLAGWSQLTPRHGPRGAAVPAVVFVCRDRRRARECAERADLLLSACRAYAGDYPHNWDYAGRKQMVFAAERDAHEGNCWAWGVPVLPSHVRTSQLPEHAGEAAGTATPVSLATLGSRT